MFVDVVSERGKMGEREREDVRERRGVRESESACDGDDDEIGEASRRRGESKAKLHGGIQDLRACTGWEER